MSKVDVLRAASDAGKKGFKLYRTLTGETVDAVQCYKKKTRCFPPRQGGRDRERRGREIEVMWRRAEAGQRQKKAGQADHSLSDINPIVGF